MRIIYYSPHPTHDIVSEVGYSTHQRETIEAMRNLGHEVLPVVMGGTDRNAVDRYHTAISVNGPLKSVLIRIFPAIVLNTLKDLKLIRHDRKAARSLKVAIETFSPDLVYERNEYMQDKGTLLCRTTGVRHFLEVNSPAVDEMRDFEGPSFLHFLGHRKERNKLKSTSRIFTVSSAMRDYLIKKYHISSDIVVNPNCINPQKEKADLTKAAEIRDELGIQNRKIVGFVGSIFPYHGVDKLIDAFEIFREKHPDWFLLIVGGGALKDDLENAAQKKLPSSDFLFTGKVPHALVMNYISLFDIAVMPASNWYGSPIKVLEYGVMQKPVVAPDNGPLRDIIIHRETGYLTKETPEDISNALAELASDENFANILGKRFYREIMENLTWEKQTQKILSFLNR